MKKVKFTLFVALAMVSFLQSCNDNDGGDYATLVAMTTLKVDGDDFHFVLDSDDTVFPGAKSYYGTYPLIDKDDNSKDGKRAIIYFTPMEQPKEGFTYNAVMYRIIDVLTKPVDIVTTEEELEPFGNAPMEIEDVWTGNGWLNILYSISAGGHKSHRISLVDNKSVTPPSETPEGYVYLEFRHHDDNDRGYLRRNYVSYKLGADYDPEITGAKGFYIKILNFNGNAEFVKVEAKSSTSRKIENNSADNFSF